MVDYLLRQIQTPIVPANLSDIPKMVHKNIDTSWQGW
jgi:hypothetical protein